MSLFRQDPGPCPICGAPHTACTTDNVAAMTTLQLPCRDAAAAAQPAPTPEFTTATYRRAVHGKDRKR